MAIILNCKMPVFAATQLVIAALPLRLSVRGSPSLANPFSGAIPSLRSSTLLGQRTFAYFRLTLRRHPCALAQNPG